MKKMILSTLCVIGFDMISNAQCDKNLVFASSKTEYLDSSYSVQRSQDETTIVTINKTDITVLINEEEKLTGTVKVVTCNWKIPFKEGKMILKAELVDKHGDTKNVVLTIEGKGGKATLLVEIESTPDRKMRMVADKYEEKS